VPNKLISKSTQLLKNKILMKWEKKQETGNNKQVVLIRKKKQKNERIFVF